MSSSCCYYGGAGNGSNCYELYDKTRMQPDRRVIGCAADEMVNSLGQKVEYYINTTTLTGADTIYGSEPTSVFEGPFILKMLITLDESSLGVSRFGFQQDDSVTSYTTYTLFEESMVLANYYKNTNQVIEPKSGDVFSMIEYGNDRQNGRGANFFEITQRRDQDVGGGNMNPLGGHYGWELKAKRKEYSWEPGLPNEQVNDQLTDDTFYGKISSTISGELSSPAKIYPNNADEDSKEQVLDMTVNNTNVYGGYDLN